MFLFAARSHRKNRWKYWQRQHRNAQNESISMRLARGVGWRKSAYKTHEPARKRLACAYKSRHRATWFRTARAVPVGYALFCSRCGLMSSSVMTASAKQQSAENATRLAAALARRQLLAAEHLRQWRSISVTTSISGCDIMGHRLRRRSAKAARRQAA